MSHKSLYIWLKNPYLFPANISTSDQRCFNVVDQRWINVDPTSGVYLSTNWLPFTGGQNSILNWVLKLNPLNQKIKK